MSAADPEVVGYLRAALTCEFPNVEGTVIGEVVDAVTAPVKDGKVASVMPARVTVAHDLARQRLWTLCSARSLNDPPAPKARS